MLSLIKIEMIKLDKQINELESFIPFQEKTNPAISSGSIGWHIEHCLLTLDRVIEKLKQSNPTDYHPKFTLWKYIVLTTQKIPRGRVKAPKIVQPKNDHTTESLFHHIASTKLCLNALKSLEKNQHFQHPYFGQLNSKQALK